MNLIQHPTYCNEMMRHLKRLLEREKLGLLLKNTQVFN